MLGFIVPLLLLVVPGIMIGLGWMAGIIPAVVFDIILISLSVRIVPQNTVKAVLFLGKYNRILRAGFNLIIPFLESTRSQDLFRKNFSVDVEWVTQDNVTSYVGLNVVYYVEDNRDDSEEGTVYRSIFIIDDVRTMMKATIDQELRAMISTFTHKEIFGKREEIGNDIEMKLREKLSSFGITLDSIQVRDVKLESNVMIAMNRVIETEKLKEASINEWESKKILQVKQAEAERDSKILLGQGMAGQRMEIAKGFKEAVDMIRSSDSSLDGAKVLNFLLDSSRIETLGNIGSTDKTKLIYLNENLEWNGFTSKSRWEKLLAGSDLVWNA
jgi:regulator of protease activity HflC (stomatin/prohibitin superfamily)